MKTPQEKAKELVEKFWYTYSITLEQAKQCALIAVNEVLEAYLFDLDEKLYYQQVKQEIEKL